jgi:uncharacterized protein YjbI with pentapeptide repeats
MNDFDNTSPSIESIDEIVEQELPDWRIHGYHVSEQLSEPHHDRMTYLAREDNSDRLVVIKEWQKLDLDDSALDHANYLPEIARLQQLDDPSIPRYLNSFQTPMGFCLVREYQPGVSLAELGTLPPSDIQLVADAVLNSLKYLYHLSPIVIHQNIKPENIIVDTETELAIYLVDFGLHPARDRSPESSSSAEPAQSQLDADYDLYSLGMSMICLLTGTSTSQSQHLFDANYHLNFERLLPANTDSQLIAWLKNMVESNQRQHYLERFTNRQMTTARERSRFDEAVPAAQVERLSFQLPEPKQQIRWWRWAMGGGLLLSLLALGYQFLPKNDELSPAQIAKNQSIARAAEFAASDRGKLIKEKRCINCNLTSQNFAKAELSGAVLAQSHLNGTNFSAANLTLAIFQDADLSGANLSQANLQRAALYGTKLLGTNLAGANLTQAKLVYAKLTGASLREANLTNADLKFAEFQQVDLRNANLTGADFSNADLSYANLSKAILTNAKLDGAILTGATMPDGSVQP